MTNKLIVAKRPTKEEQKKLDCYFWLKDWQFEELIEKSCIEISSIILSWEEPRQYIKIYGLRAVFTETQKPCISTFFIRRGYLTYQSSNLMEATEMVSLLKKEFAYEEYEQMLWKQKEAEKKLKKKKPTKKATQVQKLKAA